MISFSRIICLPDLLQVARSTAEGLLDLVREPIRQGCGIDIGYATGSGRVYGLLIGFELSEFQALAASQQTTAVDALWAKTYHRMPRAAQDYLFAHLPEDALLLSCYMPPWLRQACLERGRHFLDLRYSPLRFGRDIYIALDTSDDVLRQRIAQQAVTNEELRLEASLLGANLRSHRSRLYEGMRHTFELENTLIYVSQSPNDPALLTEGGRFQRPDEFAEQISTLAAGRQILFMVDYFNSYLSDRANQERVSLSAKLCEPVRACPQNIYQILSAADDIELVGISSSPLHEAIWFDKKVHWLAQPLISLADSPASENGYMQVHFSEIIAPVFWHGLFTPKAPEPTLARLPAIDRHQGREMMDEWGEYEKVINWERPLSWHAFERSGGVVHRRRIDALEKESVLTGRVDSVLADKAMNSMAERIQRLKNSKLGETAYILGNAPSLLSLDINELMARESFWFNKAFSLKNQGYDFSPKYYFLRDPIGFQSWGGEVIGIPAGIKFFSRETYSLAEKIWPEEISLQNVIALDVSQTAGNCMFDGEGNFSSDPSKVIYSGYTSVLDAIQVAFYMGYSTVLVGGVELDYSQPYFYGGMAPSRGGVQDWLSECTRKSFWVARKFFEKNNRVLAKITPSPHLPLEYLDNNDLRRTII